MFSFGIFTTHIPYIAFAVFYAYFLLFGVEQVSNGKIQSSENHLLSELQMERYLPATDFQNHFTSSKIDFQKQTEFEQFIFKRGTNIRINLSITAFYIGHDSPFSNRPPPFFS